MKYYEIIVNVRNIALITDYFQRLRKELQITQIKANLAVLGSFLDIKLKIIFITFMFLIKTTKAILVLQN